MDGELVERMKTMQFHLEYEVDVKETDEECGSKSKLYRKFNYVSTNLQ